MANQHRKCKAKVEANDAFKPFALYGITYYPTEPYRKEILVDYNGDEYRADIADGLSYSYVTAPNMQQLLSKVREKYKELNRKVQSIDFISSPFTKGDPSLKAETVNEDVEMVTLPKHETEVILSKAFNLLIAMEDADLPAFNDLQMQLGYDLTTKQFMDYFKQFDIDVE